MTLFRETGFKQEASMDEKLMNQSMLSNRIFIKSQSTCHKTLMY